MRIISGSAGGIPLAVPTHDLRPTTDRVREAVFSILGTRVRDAKVVDLFAGSGAYGLEALSRGAQRAVFVDQSRPAAEAIRTNAEKTRLADRAEVRQVDAFVWLRSGPEMFDIIFADPPYQKTPAEADFVQRLLAAATLRGRLAPDGIFVLESRATGGTISPTPAWKLLHQRRYGSSLISFLQAGAREAGAAT